MYEIIWRTLNAIETPAQATNGIRTIEITARIATTTTKSTNFQNSNNSCS